MPHKDPEVRRAYKAAHYAAHREEATASMAVRRAAHREEARVYAAAYRAANREKVRIKKAAYEAAHGQDIRTRRAPYFAAYRAAHQEERRAYNAAYHAAYPEKTDAKNSRRRARVAKAPVNDFTAAQWRAMLEHYGHQILLLRVPLTLVMGRSKRLAARPIPAAAEGSIKLLEQVTNKLLDSSCVISRPLLRSLRTRDSS